jgi:hypothetical protein
LKQHGFNVRIVENPVRYDGMCRWINHLKNTLYKIVHYRFLESRRIKKQRFKHRYSYQKNLLREDILDKKLGFPFPCSRMISDTLHRLYTTLPSCIDDLNSKYIIITNMQNPIAQSLISYATSKNKNVFPIVNSWDHLTHGGKAIESSSIPFYMVANQIQKKELERLHDIPAEKIRIVGSLQYEYLLEAKNDDSLSRKEIEMRFDISPDEKILFLPAYNERHGKYEPDIIEALLQRKNEIAAKFKVIIRPYPKPNMFSERFAKVLKNHNVIVSELDNDFLRDRRTMSLLLKNSDIVLSGPGTAALEAMYYDTPVIHIAIDNRETSKVDTLEKSYYFSDHYRHIMNKKASFFTMKMDEMIEAINAYLKNSSLHSAGRKAVIMEQLDQPEIPSSQRIVENILQYVKKEQKKSE